LSQAIKAPLTTHFTMPIPVPTWLVVAAVAVGLLAAWMVLFMIRARSAAK
jgi:hypothetical protein